MFKKIQWIELVRLVDKEALEPFNDDYGRKPGFISPSEARKKNGTNAKRDTNR